MRPLPTVFALTLAAVATAQCPSYSQGSVSAGLSRFNGGEDVRLVYVDCISSIGVVYAKFGNTSGNTNLNGLPLTIAVYDDPTDDLNPNDAVLVAMAQVPGGVTGGNTNQWQRYDLRTVLGNPVPTTGGMWVGVGVAYPANTNPGPGSITFGYNPAPGTQWLATDNGGGFNYNTMAANSLVDVQTGPGFPPGSWVINVESGAEYRPFGSGCQGTNGTPSLGGGILAPSLGQVAIFDAINLPNPSQAAFGLLGLALRSSPLDLGTALGSTATGCQLLVDPLANQFLTTANGTGSFAVAIPNDPNFVGISLLGQVVGFDAGANAVGVTASNGLRAVIGH